MKIPKCVMERPDPMFLKDQIPTTPAFLLDEDQVLRNLQILKQLQNASGCQILYAIKAFPLMTLLNLLKNELDGFCVSSLFEAKLAKEVLKFDGSLHLTTPGLRLAEFEELAELCTHISFNSLSQYQRHQLQEGDYSKGLRVNLKHSYLDDERYDPCRPYSKLGIDFDLLKQSLPIGIKGLHSHNVFSCQSLEPILDTLDRLKILLEKHKQLEWLNLGGGYIYQNIVELTPFIEAISAIQADFNLKVFLEPGKAMLYDAGYIVTTVLDSFKSDGRLVVVLDTTINHMPEVFEYQRQPKVMDVNQEGQKVILAGSSCLAGDLFGEYRFLLPPKVGDRLVFSNVAAYSLIKANRFNGYNFPDIYGVRGNNWYLYKEYDYQDYKKQWT